MSSLSALSVTPAPVTLTKAAVDKAASLLASDPDVVGRLRIGVRPGGCSGFSYEMFFDTELAEDDISWAAAVGDRPLEVVIDPASAKLLTGATLDYKDGLQGAGFHISNPNAQRSCGCGQSFS